MWQRFINSLKSYGGHASEHIYPANEIPKHVLDKAPKFKEIKGYRYPAPGSNDRVPNLDYNGENTYWVNSYQRNTHTREVMQPIFTSKKNLEKIRASGAVLPPMTLPNYDDGRDRTAIPVVDKYDPSGLRTTKTTSWAALNESLDKNWPDHLPMPAWYRHQDRIIQRFQSRGLPPVPGELWIPSKKETKYFYGEEPYKAKWFN